MTEAMMNFLSLFCISVGVGFWVWGSWPMLGDRTVLFKLHALSVSDTLGSMAIVVGLLFQIPREWPLLVLALIALCVWNTVLGYVLAYCSTACAADGPIGSSMTDSLIDSMTDSMTGSVGGLENSATGGSTAGNLNA